jgi:hypothetical protein
MEQIIIPRIKVLQIPGTQTIISFMQSILTTKSYYSQSIFNQLGYTKISM